MSAMSDFHYGDCCYQPKQLVQSAFICIFSIFFNVSIIIISIGLLRESYQDSYKTF